MTDLSSPGISPMTVPEGVDDAGGPAVAARPGTPLAMAAAAMWVRELRARMRGKKAFVFITIYLSALAALLWAGLRTIETDAFMGALEQVTVGRGVFGAVILIETLVVVALAPAYTAGSISQEREKQTFDLLAITPISSLAIVVGKLLSGLSYLALIVGVSIPFASLAFLFGGVDPATVVIAYLILAVAAVGIGTIGIACSAAMRRTQPATVASFLLVGALVVGLSAGWGFMSSVADSRGTPRPPEALLYLNPFLAEADLLCSTTGELCVFGVTVAAEAAPAGDGMRAEQLGPVPGTFWPKSVASWLIVTLGATFLATQSLAPSRRWRPWRRGPRLTEPRP